MARYGGEVFKLVREQYGSTAELFSSGICFIVRLHCELECQNRTSPEKMANYEHERCYRALTGFVLLLKIRS